MSENLVTQLHRTLVDALRKSRPNSLHRPVTVAEIYQDLVPYRMARSEVGFEMNADYEHTLLRLLAGEGDLARIEPREVRDKLRMELDSPNPDVSLYRNYAACDVWVSVAQDGAEKEEEVSWEEEFVGPPPSATKVDPQEIQAALLLDQEDVEIEEDIDFDDDDFDDDDDDDDFEDDEENYEDDEDFDDEDEFDDEDYEEEIEDQLEVIEDQVEEIAGQPEGGAETTAPEAEPEPVFELAPAEAPEKHACGFCGSDLPADRMVNFCPFCGSDQSQQPCPSCGEMLDPLWRFCIACGARVRPLGDHVN